MTVTTTTATTTTTTSTTTTTTTVFGHKRNMRKRNKRTKEKVKKREKKRNKKIERREKKAAFVWLSVSWLQPLFFSFTAVSICSELL